MEFRLTQDDDGAEVLVLDDVAIGYLETGLAQLRHEPVGGELQTPLLSEAGVGFLRLRRA